MPPPLYICTSLMQALGRAMASALELRRPITDPRLQRCCRSSHMASACGVIAHGSGASGRSEGARARRTRVKLAGALDLSFVLDASRTSCLGHWHLRLEITGIEGYGAQLAIWGAGGTFGALRAYARREGVRAHRAKLEPLPGAREAPPGPAAGATPTPAASER